MNIKYDKDVVLESAVSCSLSIVGGTVILASYYILPEIRNFTRKLVVCLTVADLLTAMGYLVSAGRFLVSSNVSADEMVCRIQSTITTYSSLVSFFLTSIIAIYIFDTVIEEKDRLGSGRWLVFFNALSWGVPGKTYKLTSKPSTFREAPCFTTLAKIRTKHLVMCKV